MLLISERDINVLMIFFKEFDLKIINYLLYKLMICGKICKVILMAIKNQVNDLTEQGTLRKKLLALSIPIMLSNLSQTLMSTVDTIMVGRLSREALAAAGLGNIFTLALLFPLGLLAMGTRIKIARRYGEEKWSEIGPILDNSYLLALGLGVSFVLLIVPFALPLMSFVNQDPLVGELAGRYVQIRLFAAPLLLFFLCGQAFFEASSRTNITLYSTVLVNLLNIIFNAFLIFGLWRFPALGLAGAAWGTLFATGVGFIYILSLLSNPLEKKRYHLWRLENISKQEIISILKLSVPTMIGAFGDIFSYFCFIWIHTLIGTVALAAVSVLNAIYSLVFLPAVGLGKATGILVSQFLGKGSAILAEQVVIMAMKMGFVFSSAIAALGIIFAVPLLSIYTNDLEVIALARLPLIITLTGSCVNSMGMVARQTILGAGLPVWVLKAQLAIAYLLYLPTAYILGVWLQGGIIGTFIAEATYFIWTFLVFYWKFRQKEWQFARV